MIMAQNPYTNIIFQDWTRQDGTLNELCLTGMSGGSSGKPKVAELGNVCSCSEFFITVELCSTFLKHFLFDLY